MEKTKKIGFFKRLKMSLFEMENYIEFTAEKFAKAMWFMIQMTLIFAMIMTISSIAYIYLKYQSPANYVDDVVPSFSYDKKELVINEEEKKDETKKEMAAIMQELEPMYKDVLPDGNYTKEDVINFVKNNERNLVIITTSILFVQSILDVFIFWLSVALLTSFIGIIVLRFSRIKMKFSKLYALSIYASTLSMILTVIYTMLNNYFNIYIDVFEYLSMLIAYIYITAVIYMIRSDLVKQQLELIKIATVQAQVKEKIEKEKKDEEEKKKEEKEESPEENQDAGEIADDEPDGSEI